MAYKKKFAPSKHSWVYRDKRWQALRTTRLNANPLCQPCEEKGFTEPATQVDHIKPLPHGNPFEYANTQSICDLCHIRKTNKEVSERLKEERGDEQLETKRTKNTRRYISLG